MADTKIIKKILKEIEEQINWHNQLMLSDWHKDNQVMQDGHAIAAISYEIASQIIRNHAAKTKH
jgi:hypothetical protein